MRLFIILSGVWFAASFAQVMGCEISGAAKLFEDFSKNEFFEVPKKNGFVTHRITDQNSGITIAKGLLDYQAERVVALGVEVVPVALENLVHENLHVRYIAAESLRRISGLRPIWFTYGDPGKPFNGKPDWSNEAIAVWRNWYDRKTRPE